MPPERVPTPPTAFYIAIPKDETPITPRSADRAHIVHVHDAHPGMSRRFHDVFSELMYRPGPLSRARRELIATVVSSENGCHY